MLGLSIAALIVISTAQTPPLKPVEDPRVRSARRLLDREGLKRSDKAYELREEKNFNDAVKELSAIRQRLIDAERRRLEDASKADEIHREIRKLTEEHLKVSGEVNRFRGGIDERNRLVSRANELVDRINLLNQKLEAQDRDVARLNEARQDLIKKSLELREIADHVRQRYAAVKKDDNIRKAIAVVNESGHRDLSIEESAKFAAGLRTLASYEKAIARETVNLKKDSGVWHIDAEFNGLHSARLVFDTGASFVTLPAKLAARLGVKVDSNAPILQMKTADGTIVEGRSAKIESLKVGRCSARDIACVIWPESVGDTDALLGQSFLSSFAWSFDSGRGELTLTTIGALEDRPSSSKTKRQAKKG